VVPHDWPCVKVSVPATVSIGPSAASVGLAATLRFALLGVPLLVSWVVAVVSHHYRRHQNHWGCYVSV
jgi:ABC-type transport system involved in cytochrome bd biosynthesis fused ATPase/permease subunit